MTTFSCSRVGTEYNIFMSFFVEFVSWGSRFSGENSTLWIPFIKSTCRSWFEEEEEEDPAKASVHTDGRHIDDSLGEDIRCDSRRSGWKTTNILNLTMFSPLPDSGAVMMLIHHGPISSWWTRETRTRCIRQLVMSHSLELTLDPGGSSTAKKKEESSLVHGPVGKKRHPKDTLMYEMYRTALTRSSGVTSSPFPSTSNLHVWGVFLERRG